MGRRGWKMFCAVLRDMILYLYKDEHQLKKGTFVENVNNAVRIHHSLATKATDYTKKQHVFRLQTAEYAEFLFQTRYVQNSCLKGHILFLHINVCHLTKI